MSLVSYNDPILVTPCEEFNFNTDDSMDITKKLVDAMIAYEGIGLAANQIGISKRVFAVLSNPILVFFNPVIVDYSDEIATLEESCLSYPGLIVKVTRPKHIEVKFYLPNGELREEKYTGMTARVIQHEMQHINGERFYDNLDWYEKEKVKRWKKKQLR